MKYITAVVSFAVTFGLSVLLIGVPERSFSFQPFEIQADNETAVQISFLLQQDDDNGREMEASYRMPLASLEFSQATNQYVSQSEAIDDTQLPADFRLVWQAHIKAWRTHADFLRRNSLSNQPMSRCEFSRTYNKQNQEITRTWRNVLEVAEEYGADIPEGAR